MHTQCMCFALTAECVLLQEKPSIRQMEAKNGPYAVSANFSLTNKPVNALWEWSKVLACFIALCFIVWSVTV
jgi:hypothetical protein